MKNSVRHIKVKLVHSRTGLLTEQLIAEILRERNDLLKDKSFLRCHIQHWDKFTKVCDEQLGTDLLLFVSILIAEVVEEVGTPDGWLCQSDNDNFTVIDLPTVIPKIRERLQQRFTNEGLAQDPFYISVIKKQVGGDKIPISLKLVTTIITVNDFFQIEDR